MRHNPKGGELDSADDVLRRSKKNSSSVLSRIGKKTKDGYNRCSEVGTLHSGQKSWRTYVIGNLMIEIVGDRITNFGEYS